MYVGKIVQFFIWKNVKNWKTWNIKKSSKMTVFPVWSKDGIFVFMDEFSRGFLSEAELMCVELKDIDFLQIGS